MKNLLFVLTLLLTTSLSAQNWYTVPVSTNEKLNAIVFPSSSVGYIAGNTGTLLKSTDGGETWNQINYAGINQAPGSYNFQSIEFINESIGYLTISPDIYKTIDGGTNWTEINHPDWGSFCYRHSIYAFNENSLFVGGAGCFQSAMIKKYDGPVWSDATVNYESFNASESVVDFDFYDPNLGLAATNSPYMLRTTDAGNTWDTISTGLSATGVLTSVLFMDNLLCYAGYNENGSGFGILKSIDGGLSWEQDLNSATFFYPAYNCVTKANNGDFYSGAHSGTTGLIFETVNGVDWNYYQVDQPIYAMDSYDNDVTFAVGDSGYVVVNTPLANLSITTFEKNEEAEFLVYPNPVENVLTIENILGESLILQLLDLSGRIMLSNIVVTNNKTEVDLSSLPSGAYFLRSNRDELPQVYKLIKQ